jgi:hypothetical protein
MKNNLIFFQLYNPCGLFNQTISMELAVGLSYVYKRDLVVHNLRDRPNSVYDNNRVGIYSANWQWNKRDNFLRYDQYPRIDDLLDFEPYNSIILIEDKIPYFPQEDILIEDMMDYYSSIRETSKRELAFAFKRKNLIIPPNKNIHLKRTLGQYSTFFYDRSKELDQALSKVRFKAEYIQLSEVIANSIGRFKGAHLRLTDNQYDKPTFEQFTAGLDELVGDLPVILSTDEPTNTMVLRNKDKFILLDEYIINNFEKEFKEFKFQDEVSFGLLCNLVMHYSQDFIGSSGSTFTSYIQRNMNQAGRLQGWKYWNKPPSATTGDFSWNGHPTEGNKACWYRDWDESLLNLR